MRPSTVTPNKQLPESWEDFQLLRDSGKLTYSSCGECGEPFTSANTHGAAGWRETQISGTCEDCFDALFEEN